MEQNSRFSSVKEVGEIKNTIKERNIVKGNQELILIVEDDESVMDITRQILITAYYNIVTARNGKEALDKLISMSSEIKLVLTDVIMPEMDGGTLSTIIKEKYPHIKIMFGSGYTDDILKSKGISSSEHNFVSKPYTHLKLTSAIKQLLDSDVNE